MKKVGVFGFNSEIGNLFITQLESKGFDVVNIGRKNHANKPNYRHFDLENPAKVELGDLDAIFLFSWIQNPRNAATAKLNFQGYEVIRDLIMNSSVKAVFISTMLACEFSESFHADSKYKCEELFAEKHVVVRIGQVRSSKSSVIGKSARRAQILTHISKAFRLDKPLLLPYVYETSVIHEINKILSTATVGRVTVFDGFDKLGERNRINVGFKLKASAILNIIRCLNWMISPLNLVVGDRFLALYSAQRQLFELAEKVKPFKPNSEL